MLLTFEEHFERLRKGLIYFSISFILVFILVFSFSEKLLNFLISFIFPKDIQLVTLYPLEFLNVQLKVSFILSLILLFPLILYLLIRFLEKEIEQKKGIVNILKSYFYLVIGWLISFILVSRIILASLNNSLINPMWSIERVLDFLIGVSGVMGLTSQIIIIIPFLIKQGVVTKEKLKNARPLLYPMVFLISGVVTPPDIYSQILVSVPSIILFELSLLKGGRKQK